MKMPTVVGIFGIFGWGTWIRTKINGVRVRCSTIKLFPSRNFFYNNAFRSILQPRIRSGKIGVGNLDSLGATRLRVSS